MNQSLPPMTPSFATRLIRWQRQHGRHDLPWQNTRDPYRVWLAEIMLQQTQAATVAPYYRRFLERFATLPALAAAAVEEVMSLWSGLGYYARARNLHAAARRVMREHGGVFPQTPETIARLPGVGRSTANAIAVVCFGAREPILDGNVKRVFCRVFGIEGVPGTAALESRLWRHGAELLPTRDVATYIQAQMDLGATVCTRAKPQCARCPLGDVCIARRDDRIAELPWKKPRRALPERAVTLLVLRDAQGRVLLERRPASGIWGGLLSFPELPELPELLGPLAATSDSEEARVAAYLRRTFGVAVPPAPTFFLAPFVHVFTHFRLRITPLVCMLDTPPQAMESRWQWLPAEDWHDAALPTPVRRILETLASTETTTVVTAAAVATRR